MKYKRKQFIHWIFEKTMAFYCRFKKKKPWGISTQKLLDMPSHTFGYHLGCLLARQGFDLIPKVERHDAYHLVTGFSTTVEDEIALQYACFGNGKRTLYLFGVMVLGTLILPDYWRHYIKAYRFGRDANSFHHFDYKEVLPVDFNDFRKAIFSEEMIHHIQQKEHVNNHTYGHIKIG